MLVGNRQKREREQELFEETENTPHIILSFK